MAGAGPLARCFLLVTVTLMAHVALFVHFTPAGVIIDPMILLTVGGAMVGGRVSGVSLGAACGFASDLIVHTPFGMSMLVLALVGFATGALGEQLDAIGLIVRMAASAVMSAGAIAVLGGFGWLMDLIYVTEAPLFRIAVVTGSAACILYPLTERLMMWGLVIRPVISTDRAVTERLGSGRPISERLGMRGSRDG